MNRSGALRVCSKLLRQPPQPHLPPTRRGCTASHLAPPRRIQTLRAGIRATSTMTTTSSAIAMSCCGYATGQPPPPASPVPPPPPPSSSSSAAKATPASHNNNNNNNNNNNHHHHHNNHNNNRAVVVDDDTLEEMYLSSMYGREAHEQNRTNASGSSRSSIVGGAEADEEKASDQDSEERFWEEIFLMEVCPQTPTPTSAAAATTTTAAPPPSHTNTHHEKEEEDAVHPPLSCTSPSGPETTTFAEEYMDTLFDMDDHPHPKQQAGEEEKVVKKEEDDEETQQHHQTLSTLYAELENIIVDETTEDYLLEAEAALAAEGLDLLGVSELQQVLESSPLVVPDKDGRVHPPSASAAAATSETQETKREEERESKHVDFSPLHFADHRGYLAQQDELYLSLPSQVTIPPPPPSIATRGTAAAAAAAAAAVSPHHCVLVVFGSNDLRVHDNYALALATRAAAAQQLPLVALCVVDYRCYAQPSLVGGFYRQGPHRARFSLDTVAALRQQLETRLHVPLLLRCGRPEEHVPRLAMELRAAAVYMTTQYAPHERRVQEATVAALRAGTWIHREAVQLQLTGVNNNNSKDGSASSASPEEDGEVLSQVIAHEAPASRDDGVAVVAALPTVHTVWQTTLVHLDDLPTPVAAMKEGERWYHDDVTVALIRPTAPYDAAIARAAALPRWEGLLPSEAEAAGRAPTPAVRGTLPTLAQLGYGDVVECFQFTEVVATESSHPAGEVAALARVDDWLAQGGATSLLRYGRERRTNTKLYSHKLSRLSPYLATGSLSPRLLYEKLRAYAADQQRDGFVQMQYREALLRLSRRDYWHWMGLRYGDRLFFRYGPHPEETDGIPDYRRDLKIVQRWANALTGIPFADAAMRELVGTGFVADVGRQALVWLLTRGYGQDWRLAAEWLERCSLDYDPFVCYGLSAYCSELLHDDFGEPVRSVHYLAHQHDQTGIYIKRWLPQLSRVPPVYIHRPHILTPRMQAMHTVHLGRHYPYPVKLWDGAQDTLGPRQLRAYFPGPPTRWRGPGCGEALRHGRAVLQPEELSAAVTPAAIARQDWARAFLPAATLETLTLPEGAEEGETEEELQLLLQRFTIRKNSNRMERAAAAPSS